MRLALVASVAIGMTLGILGVYLVMRRVVFFGLVLANAATLGAAVAQALGWPPEWLSLVAGVVTATALGEAGSSTRVSDEALLGWAYAAAASATVLILSRAAGGSVDTLHLLFGNVLAIEASHVIALLVLAAAVGLLQLLLAPRFLLVTFDAEGGEGRRSEDAALGARAEPVDWHRNGCRGARDRRALDLRAAGVAVDGGVAPHAQYQGRLRRGRGPGRRSPGTGAGRLVLPRSRPRVRRAQPCWCSPSRLRRSAAKSRRPRASPPGP